MDTRELLADCPRCHCGGAFEIAEGPEPWLAVVEEGELPRHWNGLVTVRCGLCGHEERLRARREVA